MTTSVEIHLNGSAHAVPAPDGPPTVAALIASLELGDRRVAVEVNGEVVPRAAHAAHVLSAGDRVEVVTFVGGG